MKMIKKTIFICSIFVFSLLGMVSVQAKPDNGYSGSKFNSCVNDGTCLLMCAYQNTLNDNVEADRSSYVYYQLDTKKWIINYYGNTAGVNTKSGSSIPKNDIFYGGDSYTNFKNGLCPKYSYIDTEGLSSELCFDDDGKYCTDKDPGGWGTTFKGTSEIKYDYANDWAAYFQNNSFQFDDVSCDAVKTSTKSATDLSKDYKDKMVKKLDEDIKKNYLHNHDIPSFLSKSEVYTNEVKKYKIIIDQQITDCKNKIEDDENLTDEEKKKNDEKLDGVNNGLNQGVDEGTTPSKDDGTTVKDKNNSVDKGEKVDDCNGFLGKEFKKWLQKAFDLIQLMGPILALVLGMIDLIRAIASGEDDAKKKAFKNVGRRLGAAVMLYLIPAVLTMILSLVDVISGSTCGIQ